MVWQVDVFGQGNGLVPPFSVLWGSIIASTWAFKNSFGCAETAACGRRVRQAAAGLHPHTKAAALPGVGMESGARGGRGVYVRACELNYYF